MRSTLPLQLRLLALPLSRPLKGDPPRFLVHALRNSLASSTTDLPTTTRYLNKAIDKAADLWAGLGKADGGWKKKTYVRRSSRLVVELARRRRCCTARLTQGSPADDGRASHGPY